MRYFHWVLMLVVGVGFAAAPAAGQDGAVELLKGAVWKFSADGGKTFGLEAMPGEAKSVVAEATFTVSDPNAFAGLWVIYDAQASHRYSGALNGKDVTGPGKENLYRAIPLDAAGLTKGVNTLVVRGPAPTGGKFSARVIGYPASLVGIQTGPILGAVTAESISVTCRTNMPATVTIAAKPVNPAGKEVSVTSPRGFYHRLTVQIPAGTRELTYTAVAAAGKTTKTDGPFKVSLPDFSGKTALRLAATGDSRTHPDRWAWVAKAVAAAKPDLLVFSGDMVAEGRWYSAWDQEFTLPARELLATVPFYAIWGNHDGPKPEFSELFYTPGGDGRKLNWTQTIGPALLIGIDGDSDWQTGSENLTWLEGVLKDSNAAYIFLFSHYPGFSTGNHGRYGEAPMVAAQKFIQPLLAKYHATAMIAGHDHNYERSEPPADKGVTAITAGGAGAPLRPQSSRAKRGNPYSKVFHATLHYCIFEIKAATCEMKVYDVNGKVIDEKVFKAREIPASAG